jgi:hypothetical protein
MSSGRQRAAIIYDFDGTLARGNIHERSFISKIGMTREQFWDEVKAETKKHDADEILVYMQLMLERAREANHHVTQAQLRDHGKDVELFAGLEDMHGSR